MTPEIWVPVVVAVLGIVGSIVTWQLGARHEAANTDSAIAEGANTAVETMLLVMIELKEQVHNLTIEAENLKEENRNLREEVLALRAEIVKFRNLSKPTS